MNWKRPIARLLKKRRKTARLLASHYLLKEQSYLVKIGWYESVYQQASVDGQGEAIPWLTYPSIAFIGPRLRSDMEVFEYGSGNSTIWWASRVAHVHSCEHDPLWHSKMAPQLPANVVYMQASLGAGYCEVIKRHTKQFEIVVIDGRERVQCVKNSLDALNDNGVIIWDNTDRGKYCPGIDFLLEAGFRRLDFWGISPIVELESCTSVFYRSNNCLNI
jgi:hypothetical protein